MSTNSDTSRRLQLEESDLMGLMQLYPNGCDIAEAADFLQVSDATVKNWVSIGREDRKGTQYKLAQIIGGDNSFAWEEEEGSDEGNDDDETDDLGDADETAFESYDDETLTPDLMDEF